MFIGFCLISSRFWAMLSSWEAKYKPYLATSRSLREWAQGLPDDDSSSGRKLLVFLDDSNLWIEGQKRAADNLKDPISKDVRYRVDFGKLMHVITSARRDYAVTDSAGFLYGSLPPSHDSMWRKAGERGFKLFLFQRSQNGEKEVDTSIVAGITKAALLCEGKRITFVVITGDRDLLPAINEASESGHFTEVWAWSHSASNVYRTLQRNDEHFRLRLFTAQDVCRIGFIATKSTHARHHINAAKAVVFKSLNRSVWENIQDRLSGLLLQFFCSFPRGTGEEFDVIVEFPNWKLDHVLPLLTPWEHLVVTYVQYSNPVRTPVFEEISPTVQAEVNTDNGEWSVVDYRSSRPARAVKKKATRCLKSYFCGKGANCRNEHTWHEQKIFREYASGVPHWRVYPCRNSPCPDGADCPFYHTVRECWCYSCRKYKVGPHGHSSDHCPHLD
eukprot:TRINITY_DN1111_c0_g1_i2.p1 TRINITY_DN1111_c0_g1~~TRINITY_DN1111_c0_g1_i2.p1  ORF type:complete len:444 (-),score=18.34 TRINITY_DN1111_c0_g1_i2:181-1512(-)